MSAIDAERFLDHSPVVMPSGEEITDDGEQYHAGSPRDHHSGWTHDSEQGLRLPGLKQHYRVILFATVDTGRLLTLSGNISPLACVDSILTR